MKKIFKLILVVCLACFAVACGNKGTDKAAEGNAEARVIKVSTKFVDDEQTAKSLVKTVAAINERSKEV